MFAHNAAYRSAGVIGASLQRCAASRAVGVKRNGVDVEHQVERLYDYHVFKNVVDPTWVVESTQGFSESNRAVHDGTSITWATT